MPADNKLTKEEASSFLELLKNRFIKNMHRHDGHQWEAIEQKLLGSPGKLWSIYQMEQTEGEPDLVLINSNALTYIDCSAESPKGRRSLCYDRAALDARKEHKPANSAIDLASEMGVRLLNEEEYRLLLGIEKVDQKTSSWILTPEPIRLLEGALFGDYRYNHTFIYHNGVQSYYAARGFRAILEI